jgi:flagellar biosynthesis protein FlhF
MSAEIAAALKFHRVPDGLAAGLAREAAAWPGYQTHEALACAIAARSGQAPLDFQKARGVLLLGPAGSGKSAVAAKIAHAAALVGRKAVLARADESLPLYRSRSAPANILTVMEADGFNPLNGRAASAFAALADTPGVECFGVVSALTDAEDTADIIALLKLRRIIVTGLDRTRRFGGLLAAITGGARLAHVTHGPRAEDALEMLEPGALAAMMLKTAAH